MNIIHNLKKIVESITGYWIYKRRHLPNGIDLIIDLEKMDFKIDVIFDVGANEGQSLKYFKKHFPTATVYSFEPVKSTFDLLYRMNQNFKNVFFENIGFGSKKETAQIFIEDHSTWNSIIPTENSTKTETIELSTIDSYVFEKDIRSISILKTDTEGFDLAVLKGAQRTLSENRISLIYVEIGLYAEDKRHSHLFDIVKYLEKFGYFFHALYDYRGYGIGNYGNALFVNKNLTSQQKVI
ncbi:MAG: FkbM family methyltransferase [Imperialibacter sp.]|uniref:FkbM family methyltransferase n=1 Tax=Imperialibacter sp. TaxID=2038411 RepID=UPI003A8C46F6